MKSSIIQFNLKRKFLLGRLHQRQSKSNCVEVPGPRFQVETNQFL